jgi:hypothetical protein
MVCRQATSDAGSSDRAEMPKGLGSQNHKMDFITTRIWVDFPDLHLGFFPNKKIKTHFDGHMGSHPSRQIDRKKRNAASK